jgi:hypothetical protein
MGARQLKSPGSFFLKLRLRGSTFRVKDKEGIKDPKFSLKMLNFPNTDIVDWLIS